MKVRMKTLAAGPNFVRHVGKVYDVTNKEAKELIAGGFAEEAKSNEEAVVEETAATDGAPEKR